MIVAVLIRLIFFILLVYIFTKVLKRLFVRPRSARNEAPSGTRNRTVSQMVQDPVCKVFLPKNEALAGEYDGATYHFCSQACRRQFETRRR